MRPLLVNPNFYSYLFCKTFFRSTFFMSSLGAVKSSIKLLKISCKRFLISDFRKFIALKARSFSVVPKGKTKSNAKKNVNDASQRHQ